MRRGCISLGDFYCDECHRLIPDTERYLLVEEEVEDTALRLCVDCCLKKDYAHYKVEKGEKVLTFFLES